MKKLTFTLLYLFSSLFLFAQLDTMVVYDVETQTVEIVPPVEFDPSLTFEKTPSFEGVLDGTVTLSDTPPTMNLYEDAQFSQIAPAVDFYDVINYPIRTAVKILLYDDDTLRSSCSGQMVGCNSVLTASHCLFNNSSEEWLFDRIEVIPAFDFGVSTLGIPPVKAEKCFILKRTFQGQDLQDIALLRLEEPIGVEIGWIGIAYAEDSFFEERVFHKLSYPADATFLGQPDLVNGDTLYYNYGLVDLFVNDMFGIQSSDSYAILGQSGSSLFFSDDTGLASLGVASWANNQHHERIIQGYFHQMKNVIEECETSGDGEVDEEFYFQIYPNPFSTIVNFEFFNPSGIEFQFELFNSIGQLVHQEKGAGANFLLERNNLSAGVYFFEISGLLAEPITGRLIAQ